MSALAGPCWLAVREALDRLLRPAEIGEREAFHPIGELRGLAGRIGVEQVLQRREAAVVLAALAVDRGDVHQHVARVRRELERPLQIGQRPVGLVHPPIDAAAECPGGGELGIEHDRFVGAVERFFGRAGAEQHFAVADDERRIGFVELDGLLPFARAPRSVAPRCQSTSAR